MPCSTKLTSKCWSALGANQYTWQAIRPGGVCLGLAIRYRSQGQRLPTALFLFSPFLDCTLTNLGIAAPQPGDPMLDVPGLQWCAEQWAGDLALTDPISSPLYDSLVGLPLFSSTRGARHLRR